ncbi:MAG: serine/threonine protein kinase [Deltaproteobacteria bacterium]|nr:serine/threonine protein kinase [Deltaproteobacteria bacterium]
MSLMQEGQIIRGTYEVERLLGEGAFAEVYRVKHRFLGRQAMKVFKMIGMTIEETEQMLGEAIMLSRISHPNIVQVFDANITETSRGICGFFTMEYVAGGNLEQYWRSHGARFVPLKSVVEIIKQVCRGLSVAHGENPPIVHRDIKPHNILVGYDAAGLRVRVSDFGLAKRVNPLTLRASTRGTRCFKAPEAFKDPQSDSCTADVWSIGATLYLLLTDRLPYADPDGYDVFDPEAFERPMLPPSRLNIEVDATIDRILEKALDRRPEHRYRDAQSLLEDLLKWKPRTGGKTSPSGGADSSGWSKSALGTHTPADEEQAKAMADQALALSRQAEMLAEAADLMEEAFNKCRDLRTKHEYQVRLWRRGIAY